jgi:dTDP-4-dehydrorhamnose reductase
MSEARVFVTGHRGMLGGVVCEVFRREGFAVSTTDERFDGQVAGGFLRAVRAAACSVIVNCVGTTAARAPGPELLLANALLPQLLACAAGGALVVHASSDGVFSGSRGNYAVSEAPDAVDPYGLSKRLGERCLELGRVVVLRTSIVGLERGSARSLLSWYLSQVEPVKGQQNVLWNGITTLAWARVALSAARGDAAFPPGLHQPASPEVISKARLLGLVREVFGAGPPIESADAATSSDRSLRPTCSMPPIAVQLRELALFGRD